MVSCVLRVYGGIIGVLSKELVMALLSSSEDLEFKNFLKYPPIEIAENAFTFLVGASGCGKSTYLKILNRTELPSRGKLFYQGKNVRDYPVLSYRAQVLLVPQDVFLFDKTIKENFDYYHQAATKPLLSESEINQYLKLCCIDFKPDTSCVSLSGGEKQRVFLAIFISVMPKVLLLDEPTAALDEKTGRQLLSNIKQFCLANHISVLCVCHNNALVKQFQDAIIYLENNHE